MSERGRFGPVIHRRSTSDQPVSTADGEPVDPDSPPTELEEGVNAGRSPRPWWRPHRRRRSRRRHVDLLVAVGVGGALGTLGRRFLTDLWPAAPTQVPWSTLTINLSGSFVLGIVLFIVFERRPPNRLLRPLLAIGLLGGYTTFSSFAVQLVQLTQHRPLSALVYLALSLAGGPAAVIGGGALARWVLSRPLDRIRKESR